MNEIRKEPSLINYLPAIYREQAEKEGHPLNALLLIFEDFFSKLEKKIDNIDIYFDPYKTPAKWITEKTYIDYIDLDLPTWISWLASWVVLELDEGWPEDKKRRLIKDAAELYKLRGTRKGLELIIERFFDIDVEIKEWEWPQGMVIGKRSSIGVDTLVEDIDMDQCFMVICKSAHPDLNNPEFVRKIRTLIDLEKPAHARYYLELPKETVKETKPGVPPMVIEVNSTIGFCYIGGV